MLTVEELFRLEPFEPEKIVKKLAFHEAGHAVMLRNLECDFSSITIPDDERIEILRISPGGTPKPYACIETDCFKLLFGNEDANEIKVEEEFKQWMNTLKSYDIVSCGGPISEYYAEYAHSLPLPIEFWKGSFNERNFSERFGEWGTSRLLDSARQSPFTANYYLQTFMQDNSTQAESCVKNSWKTIKILAEDLIEKRTLNCEEALEIIEKSLL